MSASPAPPAPQMEGNIILPPPAIKAIVDKTAAFIAKSTNTLLEDKMRAREKTDSRFAFFNPEDPYHAYYQDRLQAFRAGEQPEQKPDDKVGEVNGAAKDDSDGRPPEPPALEFLVEDPPKINAVDLDILRLTALFTARSGRRFTSELAARESRNYQFDFLRPSHSMFGYFNRLVEQYTKILLPSKELMSHIERRAGGPLSATHDRPLSGRREVLRDARQRVEWEKWESTRRQEQEDKDEAERIAFAEIDWQDFQVASTIEFTENDEAGIAELPPPMSLSEVENMSIAQKKMAAMIMEGAQIDQGAAGDDAEEEMEMDDEDDVAAALAPVAIEQTKEDVVEIQTADSSAPVKIRKDYVRTKKGGKAAQQAYTTFDGQQVPVEEFSKHVRYELLDPSWKEAKKQEDLNRAASAIMPGGTDVSASIRAIAAHRPDIFGEAGDEQERARQAAEVAKSKAREAHVWDGHAASKDSITLRYQQTADLSEQIEALHRAKGLVEVQGDGGPQIGPYVPTASTSSQIEATSLSSGASISAAPQPASLTIERTTANNNFAFAGAAPGFASPAGASASVSTPNGDEGTSVPSAPALALPPGLPARPNVSNPGEALPGPGPGSLAAQEARAAASASPAPPVAGTTRAASEEPDDAPSAKRARRADGQLYSEEEWLAAHPDPVRVQVQMPTVEDKPAWGAKGQVVEIEVPLTLLVGTVRDRIQAMTGLPVGKQRYLHNGRILANSTTLAALNFDSGDVLTCEIKKK
ncbi:hypothetical protein JCM10207_004207 [Rhodosporidiobolus poonsookiae]